MKEVSRLKMLKRKKKSCIFWLFLLHEECGVEMFIDFFSMRCGS